MMKRDREETGNAEERSGRNQSAMKEIKQVMKVRNLWLISLFFFFYLGVSMTAGGKMALKIHHFLR